MTGPEMINTALGFIGGAAPTFGLLLREKAKRQTAEATALSGAVAMAQAALAKATAAEAAVAKCEGERAGDRLKHEEQREADAERHDECEKRTHAVYEEMTKIRSELEASGALVKSDPKIVVTELGNGSGHTAWDEPVGEG